MAGELLYPILPLYMSSIGYGALWIGILEGFAEALSGLTRGWFGEWSDRRGERMPFVRIGYLLSALSKPLLALFAVAPWAIFMRTTDRLGKGVRTGARDALLADETAPETRGRVYGFHRSMDTLGAVIGPLIALFWLAAHPHAPYKQLFFWAFIPGILSVFILFLVKEKKRPVTGGMPRSPFSAFVYWKKAPADYRRLLSGILLFALFNSSDMFLLLLVKQKFPNGIFISDYHLHSDLLVVGLYIFYNLIYALCSYPAGKISDRIGYKPMLAIGYLFFAVTYGIIAWIAFGHDSQTALILAFVVYGLYAAFTDGTAKAWVSRVCDPKDKGLAMGLYAALISISTLLASLIAGLAWTFSGPVLVFIVPASAAILAFLYLIFIFEKKGSQNPNSN
jgi:MFS family permease